MNVVTPAMSSVRRDEPRRVKLNWLSSRPPEDVTGSPDCCDGEVSVEMGRSARV
ncbi:MAG: hypothetical protein ACR2MA_09115 [Egibacteraceae bacterium]